jgi:hypothetical protein
MNHDIGMENLEMFVGAIPTVAMLLPLRRNRKLIAAGVVHVE